MNGVICSHVAMKLTVWVNRTQESTAFKPSASNEARQAYEFMKDAAVRPAPNFHEMSLFARRKIFVWSFTSLSFASFRKIGTVTSATLVNISNINNISFRF